MKNNKNNKESSKIESTISKPETARKRAKRKWNHSKLTPEQIRARLLFIREKNRKLENEILQNERRSVLNNALRLAEFGFSVIPVSKDDKKPYIKWKQYQTERATADTIIKWFQKWPDAQIAVVTGPISNLAVLDFDGEGVKEKFEEGVCRIPETIMQKTGRVDGGVHCLFSYPAEGIGNSNGKIFKNVDIKGKGGYFIVATSKHKSGNHYQWLNFNPFIDDLSGLREFPEKVLQWNRNYQQSKNAPVQDRGDLNPLEILKGVPEGKRNDTLFRYACRLNNQGLSGEEIDVLVRQANNSSEKPLPDSEIQSLIKSALRYDNKRNTSVEIMPAEIKIYTATELMTSEFPEPKWAIPGILPEGLNILAGKPKIGKSMLAMNICIAVAHGIKALNFVDVERGTVLYLALEDNSRRLQRRLRNMMPSREVWHDTKNLLIAKNWPRMGEGGLRELEREIKKHSDMRLVIIDTFVKFKPVIIGKSINQYEIDYQHISRIKGLADENGISVLLIHHRIKTEAEDIFDTFSGSYGLTAAADGLLALVRGRGKTELHLTGRDLENEEYALEFVEQKLTWNILGKAEDIQSSKVKQKVYDVLNGTDAILSPKDLADLTGTKKNYVQKALAELIKEGKITRADRGKYKKKRV